MTTPHSTTTSPATPRRRWFQYSLRTLMVAMAVVGVGFAWLALQVKLALDQRGAVKSLEAAGAVVKFGEPRLWLARSEWLRSLLGDEAMFDVEDVSAWNESEFSDDEMAHLRTLTTLKILYLDNTQVTDESLAHLRGLTQLRCLALRNTKVTSAGLTQLRGLSQLDTLLLTGTQVTDEGLAHLRELTKLEGLYLNDTKVTNEGLAHLRGLTQLKWLFLNNTQVTDEGLAHLRGLTQLEAMSLTGTQVTDEGIAELKKSLPNTRITRIEE